VALAGHSSHTAEQDFRADGDEDLHSVARTTRSNRLAPEQVHAIRELHDRGVPIRAIVRQLDVNRATVRKYARCVASLECRDGALDPGAPDTSQRSVRTRDTAEARRE
jgi:Helix-turn-helix domain of resolvase